MKVVLYPVISLVAAVLTVVACQSEVKTVRL